uniref:F-BAR domain-containing protein n=1 Tax=Oryzias latipes TaxID=8090 RepID=A0A3P9IQG5_ORYLA
MQTQEDSKIVQSHSDNLKTLMEDVNHRLIFSVCLGPPVILCLNTVLQSKDICTQLQDGLLKATADLQTAWRTYHQYYSDYVCAEGKLREAEKQEEKQKQSSAKKLEMLIEKRQIKVQELHLKCSKARNDYLLNMAAANSSVMKYFLKDISFLIDCADMGYHLSVGRVMQTYLYRWGNTQEKLETNLLQLQETVSKLDQSKDKDIILQDHYNAFSIPARFTYLPQEGDQGEMCGDIETRFKQIQTRLKAVTEETEEVKGIKPSLILVFTCLYLLWVLTTVNLLCFWVWVSCSTENLSAKSSMAKRRVNMQETEGLYFTVSPSSVDNNGKEYFTLLDTFKLDV